MSIDEKIISELKRYNDINRYIIEQDVPPAPEGEAALPPPPGVDPTLPPTPGGEAAAAPVPPAAPESTTPQPVDVKTDPDVEKVGEEKDGNREE